MSPLSAAWTHKNGKRPKIDWSKGKEERMAGLMGQCTWCHSKTPIAGLEYGMCGRCIRDGKRKKNVHPDSKMRRCIVLRDPSGTYRPGAQFGWQDFVDCLKAGIWPLGMVVRNPKGALQVVCGKGRYYRTPAEKLPKQWMVTL